MRDVLQRLWFGIAGVLALGGCTFEDGEGFATLESATFSAHFEPGPGHDAGNSALVTTGGYRVTLSRLGLGLGVIRLLEPSAGEGAPPEPVVTLPIARSVDVLEQPRIVLDRAVPSRELPQANISELWLGIEALQVTGEVSAGALGTTIASLTIDLGVQRELVTALPLTIDRDEPGAFSLATELALDGTLFDDVDFATQAVDARIDIRDAEDPAAVAITSALARSALHASVD